MRIISAAYPGCREVAECLFAHANASSTALRTDKRLALPGCRHVPNRDPPESHGLNGLARLSASNIHTEQHQGGGGVGMNAEGPYYLYVVLSGDGTGD